MVKEYFYRGRHRVPSKTARNLAMISAAVAIPTLGLTGTAQAAPPGGWDPIIQCESGGNPQAKNGSSTASGLFQFLNGTWAAYGGLEFAPTARQATVAEQHIVANRAYAANGLNDWSASKACWSKKTATASVKVPKPPVAEKAAPKTAPKKLERTKSVPAPMPKPVGTPTLGTPGDYEVKSGDTLSGIAAPLGMTWQQVYEKNKNVVEHPDLIFPGERLDLN